MKLEPLPRRRVYIHGMRFRVIHRQNNQIQVLEYGRNKNMLAKNHFHVIRIRFSITTKKMRLKMNRRTLSRELVHNRNITVWVI